MYRKALLLVVATLWILDDNVHASSLLEEKESSSKRNLLTGSEPAVSNSDANFFPNFALIQGEYTTNGATFICGGALLRGDIVLTSAVCLNNTAVDLTNVLVHVNVTKSPLAADDDDGADDYKITRSIKEYVSHSEFDYDDEDGWYLYDIAIIHLNETIEGLENLDYNTNMDTPDDTSEVIIYGFGTTSEYDYTNFTQVPHQATLSVVSHDVCNQAEAWYKNKLHKDIHICAADDNNETTMAVAQDTCLGDSGAPLLSLNDDNSSYVIVGVTSGGDGCGRREVPGFYSRVSHHATFIKDQICKLSSDQSGCSFFPCFSGLTLVETLDSSSRDGRSFVAMKDLVVGDMVKVSKDRYEPIYSFGHFDKEGVVTTDFLQIETVTSSGLEITPNHFIFIEGNQAVPASSISVGDRVVLASSDGETTTDVVTSIHTVSRSGIFAPFTPSGTIVTNGIKSSSFATIQKQQRYVSLGVGSSIEIPITYHQLGVMFESPHRLFCHFIGGGMDKCIKYETYNKEDGMSNWVEIPMKLFQWLLRQNVIVSGILFLMSFVVLCIINLLEIIIIKIVPVSSFFFVCLGVAFVVGGGSYDALKLCYKKRTRSYGKMA